MLTPAYKLTLGDRVVDTTQEPQASTVVDLKISLDMDAPADSFTLVMGQVGTFRPARGDEAVIELGYADEDALFQVMAGQVVSVEPGLITRRVIGHSSAALLLNTVAGQHFEGKSAGAIVRELADQAGVELATVEDGIAFPAYVIEGRRSVYHQLHDLADLCGFNLYVDPQGRLVFQKFTGGRTVHVLEFAKHILSLEVIDEPPRADRVEAWGEGPSGSRSEQAWAWLTKDFGPSLGRAGSGSETLLQEKPVLRSAEAARTASNAAMARIQSRALRGSVLISGRPQVRLGDAIRLKDVPEDTLNRRYQVRSVTHRITKSGGFTTSIEFYEFVP